jgi:hypothetical protein
MKIWRLNQDGCSTLYQFKLKKPAISIAYDNQSKYLAIMDSECHIGFFKKDFDSPD